MGGATPGRETCLRYHLARSWCHIDTFEFRVILRLWLVPPRERVTCLPYHWPRICCHTDRFEFGVIILLWMAPPRDREICLRYFLARSWCLIDRFEFRVILLLWLVPRSVERPVYVATDLADGAISTGLNLELFFSYGWCHLGRETCLRCHLACSWCHIDRLEYGISLLMWSVAPRHQFT